MKEVTRRGGLTSIRAQVKLEVRFRFGNKGSLRDKAAAKGRCSAPALQGDQGREL